MAKLPVFFHPEASEDAIVAFEWYARHSQRVADDFQAELKNAREAIERSPNRWANYLFGTRRYLLKQFPFVVVYRVREDCIEIVAVAHGNRKPGFWRKRNAHN